VCIEVLRGMHEVDCVDGTFACFFTQAGLLGFECRSGEIVVWLSLETLSELACCAAGSLNSNQVKALPKTGDSESNR